MYQVLFSSSLSLALNCPSKPVFFIKIAALRAYLGDLSIDFVVMLRHAYLFSSFFHMLLLSARNFRHIDRIWCTVCSPCPHKSHPLVSTPPFVRRETFVAQSCPFAFEPLASLTAYRASCVFRGRPLWARLPAVLDVFLLSRSPTPSSIPLMPPWPW